MDKSVEELVKRLPKGVHIHELHWDADVTRPWLKLEVPANLKKVGVLYARQSISRTNVRGVFRELTHQEIITNVKEVCTHYDIPVERFKIIKTVITDGKHMINFRKVLKEIRLAMDRRRKMNVLGMFNQNGKMITSVSDNSPVAPLLNKLNSFKVRCNMRQEVRTVVTCATALPVGE